MQAPLYFHVRSLILSFKWSTPHIRAFVCSSESSFRRARHFRRMHGVLRRALIKGPTLVSGRSYGDGKRNAFSTMHLPVVEFIGARCMAERLSMSKHV